MNFVKEAFESNYIAPLGPQVDAFEREFAEYVGIKHCVALSSGTAAMHLALRILGVGRGDDVIALTFYPFQLKALLGKKSNHFFTHFRLRLPLNRLRI